ncbi:MAG: hypothetical protein GY765_32150 [bacterium]|nr:hypothetical protein [bacterium]
MTDRKLFKMFVGTMLFIVLLGGSFVSLNHLDAIGLSMCYGTMCSAVHEACYGNEYTHSYNHRNYCDYNICISQYTVSCRDEDCEDCTDKEREYRRSASCERYTTGCYTFSFW